VVGLIERPACAGDAADAATDDASAGIADAVQAVSVRVPRVALIRLDRDGRIAAVATNTGCAPRPGDQVYIEQADGSLVRSATLPTADWQGDFRSAGEYQAQSG
jgi:hypothetical protein